MLQSAFDFHARRSFLKYAGLGCGSLALTSLLKDEGLLSSAAAAQPPGLMQAPSSAFRTQRRKR